MAVLSDHHWPDRAAGLRELRRVARRRAVVFQFDLDAQLLDFWLVRDYLDDVPRRSAMTIDGARAATSARSGSSPCRSRTTAATAS